MEETSLTYDTLLFVDILLSEGCTEIYNSKIPESGIAYYLGPNGKKVQLCLADPEIPNLVAVGYLNQLGLHSLIPVLFPDFANQKNFFDYFKSDN